MADLRFRYGLLYPVRLEALSRKHVREAEWRQRERKRATWRLCAETCGAAISFLIACWYAARVVSGGASALEAVASGITGLLAILLLLLALLEARSWKRLAPPILLLLHADEERGLPSRAENFNERIHEWRLEATSLLRDGKEGQSVNDAARLGEALARRNDVLASEADKLGACKECPLSANAQPGP